jgi:hypothetical protein
MVTAMIDRSAYKWIALAIAIALGLCATLRAQPQSPAATLVGFAYLPADTSTPGPPSGVFRVNGQRGEGFKSQPVQGVSAIRPDPSRPGSWLALSDNGFGNRLNSPDYLLNIFSARPAWRTATGGAGTIDVGGVIRLADPNRRLPFRIVREGTPERWLTGSDLDPESFVLMPDGTFWIGDEFGPFLLHVDARGRVLAPPAAAPGLVSPDQPGTLPPDLGQPNAATVRRSRGFEALGASADHTRLYAMLEASSTLDPPNEARILEFDPARGDFTGRMWRYRFETNDHSATELTMYAPDRFLVVERDGGHGPDAKFKRVFAIRLGEPSGVVEKWLALDLLNISDPNRLGGQGPVFTFPFQTTEAVWAEDASTLVLANDNNFPAAGGRTKDVPDGTEFIRVRLATPLPH